MIDINSIFSKIKLTEKILLACYYYAYPTEEFNLDDSEYDKLKSQLPIYHPYNYMNWDTLLNVSNVDSLLERLQLPKTKEIHTIKEGTTVHDEKMDATNRLRSLFSEAKSMQMVQSMQPIYDDYLPQIADIVWSRKLPLELVFSYKMDGWNITSYFKRGNNCDNYGREQVFLAHSRGRTTENVSDCTHLFKKMLPSVSFNNSDLECFATRGELCLKRSGLNILKEAYPTKALMNVRNSVSALVHQTIDIEKYNNNVATYFAFNFMLPNTETAFSTVEQMYQFMTNLGFNVPVYQVMRVPYKDNKEEFLKDIQKAFESTFKSMEDYYLSTVSLEYEADGCVIQPNDMTIGSSISNIVTGNFGSGLLAVKAGRVWGKKIYQSKVTSIYFTKARVNKSVMCTIEPVQSNLGTTITRVELDNLRNAIIVHDVRVGDTIEFTLHSQQIIQILKNQSAIERNKGVS